MADRRIGIAMHGVTGRMGLNQHLLRSVLAIRDAGGVPLANGDRLVPDILIVGRNAEKIERLAAAHGIARWGTDLDAVLADADFPVFFDAGTTQMRAGLVAKAIEAGKHVYCEKPTSDTLEDALAIARLAREKGVKNGVVQDKLFLPGLLKMKRLVDAGFFGRLLSLRVEFGYWVFEGDLEPAQRPSWNYKRAEGGGIVLDMLCHWRYVLDNLFGGVESVSCLDVVHIPERRDETGAVYDADADDAAYATIRLAGGAIAQINSSWCVRPRRDDLVTFHADGTRGSAVAGLTRCWTQDRVNTPKPVWNPDEPQKVNLFENWAEVPDRDPPRNGFRIQWEAFLRHVAEDGPWSHDLLEGAKGVQLAEIGYRSSAERRWLDVPPLSI